VDIGRGAADNRQPLGQNEGAVKLGYFHNGHFPPIEFEDFVRWGAANGYQVIDVPLFQPNARAICERHGLEPTSTTGMVCQPIATDATERPSKPPRPAGRWTSPPPSRSRSRGWAIKWRPTWGLTPTYAYSPREWRRYWTTRSGSVFAW
jgi:hypothetical protein